uniref:Otopetrin-2 n=1 Tax=Panagrellus redivivus TaxID=6233 RepID=A0A7E4VYH9_PANRE
MVASPAAPHRKWMFHIHHLCIICLYIIFLICIFLNLYVLLSRGDTIYYLRLYHMIVGILMVCCCIVMLEFMWRTRCLPKLDSPHEMPRPALVGAIVLTIGIVLGYAYFIVFNYAFSDCDKLVDAMYGTELWLDAVYSSLMIVFCSLVLIYILHRSYYGAINTHLDKVTRLWVNVTIIVVWVKVVVYKGYLSHQELCKRKELEGYWCPVVKRYYDCDPYSDLIGMQKVWFYLNKGLLSSATISCASEYFPVVLVAHWLACGGAEEKAEDLLKRKRIKQGFRGLLREFMKDVSRVYSEEPMVHAPRLHPSKLIKIGFNLAFIGGTVAATAYWFVNFYNTINFDDLVAQKWLTGEYVRIVACIVQALMFVILYLWTRQLSDDRLDAHHKAEARGDIIILFGCVIVLTVKYALQIVELRYQFGDHFINLEEMILHMSSLTLTEITQWSQYLVVRRLLALSNRDLRDVKAFLPTIALAGCFCGWIHFGITFLETSLIKYQLSDETFHFSEVTLISMIFTQTLFPADYLFAFTVAGCWMDLIIRYMEMGAFQLGVPRLVSEHMIHEILEGNDSPTFIAKAFTYARNRGATGSSVSSESGIEVKQESNGTAVHLENGKHV